MPLEPPLVPLVPVSYAAFQALIAWISLTLIASEGTSARGPPEPPDPPDPDPEPPEPPDPDPEPELPDPLDPDPEPPLPDPEPPLPLLPDPEPPEPELPLPPEPVPLPPEPVPFPELLDDPLLACAVPELTMIEPQPAKSEAAIRRESKPAVQRSVLMVRPRRVNLSASTRACRHCCAGMPALSPWHSPLTVLHDPFFSCAVNQKVRVVICIGNHTNVPDRVEAK